MTRDDESDEHAVQAAGRGLLVDDSVSAETREAMARETAAAIRERRRTVWNPSGREDAESPPSRQRGP